MFTLGSLRTVPAVVQEEISWWNNVDWHCLDTFLGVKSLRRLRLDDPSLVIDIMARLGPGAVWVKFGYAFDPLRNPIRLWETSLSNIEWFNILAKGRDRLVKLQGMMKQTRSCLEFFQEFDIRYSDETSLDTTTSEQTTGIISLKSLYQGMRPVIITCDSLGSTSVQRYPLEDLGFYPVNLTDKLGCHIDIKMGNHYTNLLIEEVSSTPLTKQSKVLLDSTKGGVKKIALGLPTTSRGLGRGALPIFLIHLLPSLLETLTEQETNSMLITLYIGIDQGDPLIAYRKNHKLMMQKTIELIGHYPIQVKFIMLPNIRRIAQLWNLLFIRAMRDGMDYFYQVNDDLTLLSPGWLTHHTRNLDENGGFGVVGPADIYNNFNCVLLTQAMVSRTHFEIFGTFYPPEIKDWQCDTWITRIYSPQHVYCSQNVTARNGGSPTRYDHCMMLHYGIYVDQALRQIQKWKASKE